MAVNLTNDRGEGRGQTPNRRARGKPSRSGISSYPGDPQFYRGDDYRIEESVGYLMRQVRIQMERAIDAEMAELDLTRVQWGPLLAMHFGLADTAAELARLMCVDTGAMTRMLDRLEAKNLIERSRCPKDARVVRLELTDEGKRLCREIPYGLSRVLNGLLRSFNERELATLKSLLRRMLANAQTSG